jgi:signal transduction histidine kinase
MTSELNLKREDVPAASQKADEPLGKPLSELYLKTEQLLYFRLTFALASLGVALLVGYFARFEFSFSCVIILIFVVAFYSLIGLDLLKRERIGQEKGLRALNGIYIGLDIASLTLLIHLTHGIDSDLYFLFLLPILLSSHTFGRKGIYLTATAASFSYVGVIIAENLDLFPYLVSSSHGLSGAYMERLWVRIVSRSAILVSVSYIWGAFCDYMSQVSEHGANRLREQLNANQKLVTESRAQAAREQLINAISSAIRSTLDLDEILKTTVSQLSSALSATRCAIVCPAKPGESTPVVWETVHSAFESEAISQISADFCRFILTNKSSYEEYGDEGVIKKTFVFDEPIREWAFREVRDDLSRLGFRSLVVQPIMYGVESKGVLLIAQCDRRRRWASSELELVKSVAGQVAIAIEHARLVDQLSRKNKDLLQKNLQLDSKNLELRTTQSQLIHQEKMASLGRMVAGIAHELNNPVNFVHGNLPYLREYFDDLKRIVAACDELPDLERAPVAELKKTLKYDFLVTDLDNIIADLAEGAERIRQIIKNLRSFSRLDEAELKEASVQEGIESSLKILSQYYGRDKIRAILQFEEIPPVTCFAGQLNQVWVNLLSNAAEALSGIPDPQVVISAALESEWVLVSIADNGPGIKSPDQSKIFEPFFTTKPVGQGTGLGLSICHSIIERHGGQIWFECKPGGGTTFRVKIPLKAQPREPLKLDEPEQ